MGASHKEAARAYMREHPGVTFPAAKRAVTRGAAGTPPPRTPTPDPWVRRAEMDEDPLAVKCYFCGHDTMIRSSGDLPIDLRRVQVYCDNDQCDAREVEVIVMDDGSPATSGRADVCILRRFGPVADRPADTLIEEFGDWIAGATPAARRGPSVCLFCGSTACTPAAADVSTDTGRIRLRCTDTRCSVTEFEVLVIRDGTPWTQDRDDVSALERIFPRRQGTQVGGMTFHSIDDFRFPPEEILARRVSGPMP